MRRRLAALTRTPRARAARPQIELNQISLRTPVDQSDRRELRSLEVQPTDIWLIVGSPERRINTPHPYLPADRARWAARDAAGGPGSKKALPGTALRGGPGLTGTTQCPE